MHYFDPYSTHPDRVIVGAWDSRLQHADNTSCLAELLPQYGSEIFLRFAACCAELRALPRGARRALQRRLAHSSELAAIMPEYLQQGGRKLQHRMAWSLAGAALLLALTQSVATAATITVTTNNPNIAADGQCSLIEAIVNANNDAATHADCAAGSGADTIMLPVNASITLSNAHVTIYGTPTGLPLINSPITIQGNGATIARDRNAPAFSLVRNHGELILQNLTLSGGAGFGAGLFNGGNLTIQTSIVSGNVGGGVTNWATLTIENSSISNNTATSWGGGLYNSGTVTIITSTISGNSAGTSGGGVYNWGNLIIENSTISGNSSSVLAGGLFNTGSLTITNSTISENIALEAGGLLNTYYCYFGCSFGYLTLNNSLVAGNQAPVAPEIQNFATIDATNFNLFGTNGDTGVCGFTPGPTDIVPAPGVALTAILGPLANNGGPTQTHALLTGSPAVNVGNPSGCRDDTSELLLTDQRGFPRPSAGTICDIGSYELQGSNSLQPALNAALPADTVPVSATCSPASLAIGAATLATGEAGAPFTSDLKITGGVAPYTVSIANGKLPAGLSVGNDGIISGTLSPNAKSEKITVRITDSLNAVVTQIFTLTIVKAVRIAGKAKTGRVGKDYRDSLKAKGGRGPFSWSITSGALPSGLNFNTTTGAITGIPTQAGEFPLTVQVTDALGGVDVETLALKIK